MPLTVKQAANDLLSKLGIEGSDPSLASALAQQDVVIALNGAMQMLQTAGQDFFTRAQVTLTLSVGTSIYWIPATIQAVLGPVLWNASKPLRALTSLGEFDQFARIFQGGSAYGAGSGEPVAYFVEFLRNGTSGDICQPVMKVAPAPTSPAGTLAFDVVNDAVSYAVADLTSTNTLPVAQSYTESVFLPIARMLVTRSSQFSRPDLLAQLTSDYQLAMTKLSTVGGFPNAEQPTPTPRATEA
jgi:hypothetical protein